MRKLFKIIVASFLTALSAKAGALKGAWAGALDVAGAKLHIVIHFDEDGCSLDSPDQGAKGIPAKIIVNDERSVAIEIPSLNAKYYGSVKEGELRGWFTQNHTTLPLNLTQGEYTLNRPQTPQPPFPYSTHELTFTNEHDGATLSGTLTLPPDVENPPIVVMVSGSGQQNRDEEIFGHKPFAVIADRLARNSIATFRYDDRGVGQSTGLRPDITTADNCADAIAAINMLRNLGYSGKIGVLGHSEGGMIAFMIAARQPAIIDFIITMAAPAVKGEQLITTQIRNIAAAHGQHMTDAQIAAAIQAGKANPWYAYFVDYDPTADVEAVECPVFAANGSLDIQVDAEQNLGALRKHLHQKSGDEIKQYEGLNHLFQHAATGLPEEYSAIEETLAEEFLTDLTSWLQSLPK